MAANMKRFILLLFFICGMVSAVTTTTAPVTTTTAAVTTTTAAAPVTTTTAAAPVTAMSSDVIFQLCAEELAPAVKTCGDLGITFGPPPSTEETIVSTVILNGVACSQTLIDTVNTAFGAATSASRVTTTCQLPVTTTTAAPVTNTTAAPVTNTTTAAPVTNTTAAVDPCVAVLEAVSGSLDVDACNGLKNLGDMFAAVTTTTAAVTNTTAAVTNTTAAVEVTEAPTTTTAVDARRLEEQSATMQISAVYSNSSAANAASSVIQGANFDVVLMDELKVANPSLAADIAVGKITVQVTTTASATTTTVKATTKKEDATVAVMGDENSSVQFYLTTSIAAIVLAMM